MGRKKSRKPMVRFWKWISRSLPSAIGKMLGRSAGGSAAASGSLRSIRPSDQRHQIAMGRMFKRSDPR